MQDSLTKINEDITALQVSVTELAEQLTGTVAPSLADEVLVAVTNLLVAQGWTAPATQVEVTQE